MANKNYCGLCRRETWLPSHHEPINWADYDRYGRERITHSDWVRFNQLPEKVQLRIKQTEANIEEDALLCPECFSKTLDEIWLAERAICKECNIGLVNIGWSLEQPSGHSVMSIRLMGCPKCRLVYYIPWRPPLEST